MSEEEPVQRKGKPGGVSPLTGHAPPGSIHGWGKANEAKREIREREQRVMEAATGENPTLVIRELFGEASKAALSLYRRFNRSAGKEGADKGLIEVSKEARQLADRLLDIIQTEGQDAEAEEFFATLEQRFSSQAQALEPVPLVEP